MDKREREGGRKGGREREREIEREDGRPSGGLSPCPLLTQAQVVLP